jgi:ribosomal protein L37AE/L43A
LATDPSSPQRAYRAACPNCGAPVEFRSSASAFAVCSFCRSTIVRDGEALRKTGESAELFDDHSPLQLGASGSVQGAAFTLVGRLQYRYNDGTWNEWHALFDTGEENARSGWLAEDNGRYVLAFDATLSEAPPPAEKLRPGQSLTLAGQGWSVASVAAAKLIAAQGELPFAPNTQRGFMVVDLRNPRGEVGTLDYQNPDQPHWSVGRSVALSELALRGLAEGSEKTLQARGVQCPSCGTALNIKLSTTQSIVCHQCHAVVDLSGDNKAGVGSDLAHYAQQNGSEPQIPLGSIGRLKLSLDKNATVLPWQVVGYAERCEVETGEDEQSFWREYLLYHRDTGFAFLVDAQDGWSWATPITGVPQKFGESVKLDGVLYKNLYEYTGKTTYVLGEFYWQLKRDELTYNSDYIGTGEAKTNRLNREQSGDEITWSLGSTLTADEVMQAFKLAADKRASLQRDALPTALDGSSLLQQIVLWSLVILVLLILWRCDNQDDCSQVRATYGEASSEYRSCRTSSGGYRSSGGSWGGYSSGGGHK